MKHQIFILSLFVFSGVGGPVANAEDRGAKQLPLQTVQARWDEEAEQAFWMGRGMGRQLMTQEEWQEHQKKMQTLGPEERQRYREEWHKKMAERARERGITMPETPGPHRGGSSAGMGSGGGMGGGPRGGRR